MFQVTTYIVVNSNFQKSHKSSSVKIQNWDLHVSHLIATKMHHYGAQKCPRVYKLKILTIGSLKLKGKLTWMKKKKNTHTHKGFQTENINVNYEKLSSF